ncbi:MAG: hypothetical protein FJ115_07495 [Deltaproteobacteria bacterium]|nr:hypothetical protein [Deltaproteobacteria bacterium]
MNANIINTVLAVFTFVLAIATVWLAFATWRMASITKKAFDLESRAYFGFKSFIFKFLVEKSDKDAPHPTKGHLKVGLIFGNPGKVLVHYQVKSIRVTFSGTTINNPHFERMGGPIYPNDTTVFWYGVIQNVDISSFPKSGNAEYTVEYHGVPGKGTHTTRRKIQYTINSVEPPDIDWIYLEEEDI